MARQERQPIVTMIAGICLTRPVEQGDDVGSHVDAGLTALHGHQTHSFAEHACDPVDRGCRVERHGDS